MNLEQISCSIIAYSGDGFSKMREAIRSARNGEVEEAENQFDEGKKLLKEAHDIHTEILVNEAQGKPSGYSTLLAHAQDTMMNAILFETIAEEFIEMYKERNIQRNV